MESTHYSCRLPAKTFDKKTPKMFDSSQNPDSNLFQDSSLLSRTHYFGVLCNVDVFPVT